MDMAYKLEGVVRNNHTTRVATDIAHNTPTPGRYIHGYLVISLTKARRTRRRGC